LEAVTAFFRDRVGFHELGGFADHDGYDGVFLAVPGTGTLAVRAGQVLSKIQETMADAKDTLTQQFTRAIASDYGRLKAVGRCGGEVTRGCPNANPWRFEDSDAKAAKNALLVRHADRDVRGPSARPLPALPARP
jgi:hypothetical protein